MLLRLATLVVIGTAMGTAHAQAPAEPYGVTVWARAVFGVDGRCTEHSVVDEAELPAAFAQAVKSRLDRARIQPVLADGQPGVFKTGVRMEFTITPGSSGGTGATVKLDGLVMEPLVLKKYLASYPKDVARTADWNGAVSATCTVGPQGVCTEITVDSLPGMPESLRRFAKASFEGWRFEPQLLNGQPVPADVKANFSLQTLDTQPDNFRRSKFERLQSGR